MPLILKQKTRLKQTTASQYLYCLILAEFLKEKMYKRLKPLLNGKETLNGSQYQFSEKYSTQHAIIEFLNTMKTNLDRHLYSCDVFIDVKKALDTVEHSLLLNKLHQHGFRGVINNWFSSYLRNWTQTTQVGSHISKNSNTVRCLTRICIRKDPVLISRHCARVFVLVFTRARQPLCLRSSKWKGIFVAASIM